MASRSVVLVTATVNDASAPASGTMSATFRDAPFETVSAGAAGEGPLLPREWSVTTKKLYHALLTAAGPLSSRDCSAQQSPQRVSRNTEDDGVDGCLSPICSRGARGARRCRKRSRRRSRRPGSSEKKELALSSTASVDSPQRAWRASRQEAREPCRSPATRAAHRHRSRSAPGDTRGRRRIPPRKPRSETSA